MIAKEHGLLVNFKRTKTIQFGERRLHIPLLPIKGCPLCPVTVFQRMLELVPASHNSPLFLLPVNEHPRILTKSKFIAEFRKILRLAGISDASNYRGHSFRRGAASWAFNSGVPGELIQLYGDWSSDAYKVYLEFDLQSKLRLAQQLRSSMLISTSLSHSPCSVLARVWWQ